MHLIQAYVNRKVIKQHKAYFLTFEILCIYVVGIWYQFQKPKFVFSFYLFIFVFFLVYIFDDIFKI